MEIFIMIIVKTVVAVVMAVSLILMIHSKEKEESNKLSRKVELSGYVILLIAILLGFTQNSVNNIAGDGELLIINEKLNKIMLYQKDSLYQNNGELIENHYGDFDKAMHFVNANKNVERQQKIINCVNSILFSISTILIAFGRCNELIVSVFSNDIMEIGE